MSGSLLSGLPARPEAARIQSRSSASSGGRAPTVRRASRSSRIAAVIAMVSARGGARYKLDDRLESVGKNLILMKPGSRTQLGIAADSTPLRKEDAAATKETSAGGNKGRNRASGSLSRLLAIV